MGTTMTRPRADWSLRPRGTASAVGQGALALAALGTVGHDMLHLHPGWAAAGTAVGLAGTVITGINPPPLALAYRFGCWLAGGGWLAWALTHGMWDLNTLAALGVGGLAAGMLAPLTRRPAPQPSEAKGSTLVVRRHSQLADEWIDRIRRVADVKVQVEELREWDGRSGFSALLKQPPGASTTTKLANAATGMAEDAGLPNGCSVEFAPGPRRGTRWMHVATVNRLVETIDHPGIRLGGSINDPGAIRLGGHRDGSTASVALRESTMVLAGQKRSGKTGTLHNITADAASLDDCLVWHMDLNGGGVSRAWLRPWMEGRTQRPAIDWAAPCKEEALLMARALVDIAVDRKSAHADLKAELDVQLLPVSREVPAILLILDEGKEVLGTKITDAVIRQIRRALETVVDIGGNEACNAVLSVLRSISTALSTDILKQCSTRATMRVFDQSELDYLLGYHRGITPQDATEQGSGFLQATGEAVRVFKAYYMVPSSIAAAAVQIAEHRPDLDADAVRAAGEAYATRLERMRYLYSTAAVQATLPDPAPVVLPGFEDDEPWYPAGHTSSGDEQAPAGQGTIAKRKRGHLMLLPQGGATAGWGDPEQIAAHARGERPRPARQSHAHGPRPRLHAEQIHEVEGGHPMPELLKCALALPWDEGRLHSVVMAKHLGMTEHELAALLGALGVTALRNAFLRGGTRGRGYEREDLEDAAEAIRRGELQVPAEVADWPAA